MRDFIRNIDWSMFVGLLLLCLFAIFVVGATFLIKFTLVPLVGSFLAITINVVVVLAGLFGFLELFLRY